MMTRLAIFSARNRHSAPSARCRTLGHLLSLRDDERVGAEHALRAAVGRACHRHRLGRGHLEIDEIGGGS